MGDYQPSEGETLQGIEQSLDLISNELEQWIEPIHGQLERIANALDKLVDRGLER